MQRAMVALFNGDIMECMRLNVAAPLLLLMLVFTGFHLLFRFRRGPQIILWMFMGTVSLMIVNYIGRLGQLW